MEALRDGITMIRGRASKNLLFGPMVSSTYLIDAGDTVVLYDTACGGRAARNTASVLKDADNRKKWKTGAVVLGHTHMDHANNLQLAELMPAENRKILVHESGVSGGKLLNSPYRMIHFMVDSARSLYSVYRGFPFPYSLMMTPLAWLDRLAPAAARSTFAAIGALAWPRPRKARRELTVLSDDAMTDAASLGLPEGFTGWPVGDSVIIPTPGHSPCSVSLVSPRLKAVLVSDADYVGNPVFINGNIENLIHSLGRIRALAENGTIDLLLSAHDDPVEGSEEIVRHISSRISRFEALRDEVLVIHRETGSTDVGYLTRLLADRSPLYREMKENHYPRSVYFPEVPVARALIESGLIQSSV